MSSKTIFGHFLRAASAVYRVTTESSIYILGFHEERGRRFVVVRGLPGTDREHVVLRDSDPWIGEASMYELAPDAWVGKLMEIATMTSSAVTAVAAETDRAAIASVGGESPSAQATWMRPPAARDPAPAWPPRPPGIPDLPGQRSGLGRGTNPAVGDAAPRGVGYNVVTGQQPQSGSAGTASEPELPYPQRHVHYAENAATLLRAIARRDRLWEDVDADRALKDRLYKSLDDCAELVELIRRRNRR
jgi:hypothetical protein